MLSSARPCCRPPVPVPCVGGWERAAKHLRLDLDLQPAHLINGERAVRDGRDEEGQLREIFDVLGYRDERTWPWFSSMPFAIEWLPLDYR